MNRDTNQFDVPPLSARPRLISVDDNIRTIGGHFFELATLLLEGAQELGLQPVLGTNACFDGQAFVNPAWPLARVFNTRRMVRWSLGVDGNSRTRRDLSGRPIGGTSVQNSWTQMTDIIGRPKYRPATMIRQWADDLSSLLTLCKPTPNDSLLVNTGDDFVMLALASALQRLKLPFPIRIDVIFHFAVYDNPTKDKQRLNQFGQQINHCLDSLKPHHIHLHATTDSLASQMQESMIRERVNPISYPTRVREIAAGSETGKPVKIVLAGLPRAEKGRASITTLLQAIDRPLLQSGQARVSMQMPAENWESMVPESLHASYRQVVSQRDDTGPLEVMTSNLTTDDYHRWLDSSDIGLFLYAPDRYVARCSGVLLEMMVRGVPVIVPDHCWLADQVREANATSSAAAVGFVYQNRDEIPSLLKAFIDQRHATRESAIRHAATIAARHNGVNTIRELGIETSQEIQRVA